MTLQRGPAPKLPRFIASQLPDGLDRYTVRVDGVRFHVMEIGSGRPVLLLHGNPTWGFLYRKVLAALTGEDVRCVVPDLIGLGFSSRVPASDHTLDNHGRWMGALIDALDLDDVVFVGQDWGGAVGLLPFCDRPERLTGMVLLNTVVSPPRPGFKATPFHRFARAPGVSDVAFRVLGFPQVGLGMAQGDRKSIRGAVARAYRYPLRWGKGNVAPLALARMVPDTFEHPSIAPLQRVQALVEGFDGPSALVWGDRDPILGRVIGWMQKLLPGASVTRTQAGHFLQEEVPAEIAAAIRQVVGS